MDLGFVVEGVRSNGGISAVRLWDEGAWGRMQDVGDVSE